MGLIALVGFAAWCLVALKSRPAALILFLLLFSTEQILQSSNDFARNSSAGLALVNYLIAGTVALSAAASVVRRPDLLRGTLSVGQVAVFLLYVWTIVSCWWSPGAEAGFQTLRTQWPYFVVMFVIAPLLVGDIRDLTSAWRVMLIVVVLQSLFMLASPEFKVVGGRLGVDLGGSWRSNPLIIGEVGGYCMILGALAGSGGKSRWMLGFRVSAIILGVVIAILSGSRGQFLFAIVALVFGLPLTKPNLDGRRYVLGVITAAILIPLILWVASTVIESGGADMMKRWSSGSSDEGTQGRAESAMALISAYLGSPSHWLQGLGFYAFGAMNSYGEPYTHVLFADVLGEEGLIGTAIFTVIVWSATSAARELWKWSTESSPDDCKSVATLITLTIYQMLLVNKQGNMALGFVFFGLIVLTCRLRERLRNDIFNDLNT